MASLKPCPFCDSDHLSARIDLHDGWWIACDKCGAAGPLGKFRTQQQAEDAWNARADPWRPIGEDTPEHDILLWNGEDVVQSGRRDMGGQWWDAFDVNDREYGIPMQPQPIRWMPMPEPPRGNEQ